MDSAKLNDWMQVVGIFALVASLIFVGLQLKQSHEIALANQFQARTAEFLAMSRTGVEVDWTYPPLRPYVTDEMSAGDISGIVWAWTGFDNHNFQYEAGFLTEESWQAQVRGHKEIYGNCDYRPIYEFMKNRMRASVIDLVEGWDDLCTDSN